MNFPENALIKFVYWFINTPGLGGVAVSLLGLGIFTVVGLALRWIAKGADANEAETYVYPTPALHHHGED